MATWPQGTGSGRNSSRRGAAPPPREPVATATGRERGCAGGLLLSQLAHAQYNMRVGLAPQLPGWPVETRTTRGSSVCTGSRLASASGRGNAFQACRRTWVPESPTRRVLNDYRARTWLPSPWMGHLSDVWDACSWSLSPRVPLPDTTCIEHRSPGTLYVSLCARKQRSPPLKLRET